MKLTVFNGSPRAYSSNTRAFLESFLKGYSENEGNSFDIYYLSQSDDIDLLVRQFNTAENIIFAFPLYFDSMPAIVKQFIEAINIDSDNIKNKSIGYILQSGFPEPNQFFYLEKYLSKLTIRLKCTYTGTVIRGAGEGIRINSNLKKPIHKIVHFIGRTTNLGGVGYFLNNKRSFRLFYQLGKYYGQTGTFQKTTKETLAKPKKLTTVGFYLFSLITNKLYFNVLCEKNNALHKLSDQPYRI